MSHEYQITVVDDGVIVSEFFYPNAIAAVEAWQKFVDYGDAKNYREVTFKPLSEQTSVKTFFRYGAFTE